MVNKTTDCMCKPDIKLDGGKLLLEPTLKEIDNNNFCIMLNYELNINFMSSSYISSGIGVYNTTS